MLCTVALLKNIQIPSDISSGIYFRKALKLKRVVDFKIVVIVDKRKFDTELYDSFVE